MNPPSNPNPQSTADRNVEQLLSHAYCPESPDPGFASRTTEMLIQRSTKRVEYTMHRKLPNRWTKLAVLGIAAGIVIATGLFAIHFLHHRSVLPVAQGGGEPVNPPKQITENALADQPHPQRAEESARIVPAHRLPDPPVATVAPGRSIKTQAGERRRIALVDGSRLFIDQSTQVSVDAPRTITISTGEVFVEVAPRDENDPFIVHTPQRQVRAIGTKFDVRVADAGTNVIVTQGKVRIDGIAEAIAAGQQIPALGMPAVQPAPAAASVLDWTRDLVTASRLPLVAPSGYAGGAVAVRDATGRESFLSLRKYLVDVHIEDGFARTTIDQTYFNQEYSRTEGTFYFPLPPDASISRLAMYVDGKLMEGGMTERSVARKTYESIVRTQRDPALLEWVDGNTFKMRVFPLEPRQEKRIILSYVQRMPSSYGKWEYRFPAARNPGGAAEFAVHARIKDGAKMRWNCPSHSLGATVEKNDLLLDGHESLTVLDRDVIIQGSEKGAAGDESAGQFAETTIDGHRYLMVRCRPVLQTEKRRERRDWIFIFEASGNRSPLLARAQVDAIAELLANGEHDDTFQILTVETRAQSLTTGPTPATPENVRTAIAKLETAHLVGGLDLSMALDAAAAMAREAHNPWIVHVGSAMPTLGERRTAQLVGRIPSGAHYVGIGIGRPWGRAFMKAAAEQSAGYVTQINPDESIPWRAIEIASTLNTQRLLQLKVGDDAGRNAFLNCDEMISAGQEICAVTRLDPSGDLPKSVTLSATLDGKKWMRTFPVTGVTKNAGYLPRLWAKLEIDRLVTEDSDRNHDAIVELSKSMYVMSPFTSLLVLENEAMYAQFNIDRGRKDHWAMYPCPDRIDIIKESLAASRNDAASPPPAHSTPSPLDILRTIVTRPQPIQIDTGHLDRMTSPAFESIAGMETVTRVYDVRDLILNVPDFNDAPDFSLTVGRSSPAAVAPDPSSAGKALADLKTTARLQEIQRQQDEYESQQKTRQALATESANLDQARQLYSQAISLDPDNAQAKAGLSRVLILQARGTPNTSMLDQQAKRNQTQTQEITYQFDQAIADARAAIVRKDFQAASTDLQRAGVARFQNPNIFSPEAARNFDNEIRRTQLALDTVREQAIDDANASSAPETAHLLARQKQAEEAQRRRTVVELRATAMRLTEEARYRDAIGVVDQINVLDPTDEYANGVRPLLEDKFDFQQRRLFVQNRDINFTKQLNKAESGDSPFQGLFGVRDYAVTDPFQPFTQKTIPYDDILRYPSDWPDIIRTRDATVQAERGENKEDRAVQSQLDRPLPELTFDAVGFSDVIDFLRDVSGANIFVNWKSLQAAGIDRNAPVTLKLRNVKFSQALSRVLVTVGSEVRLGYRIENNVIDISTEAELRRGEQVTRVYDVRDVLHTGLPDFNDAPDFSLAPTTRPDTEPGASPSSGGLFQPSRILGETRQDQVDKLIHLVTETIAPDSWRDAGGEFGSIKELSGQLIVTQTPENHRQIVYLLGQMRKQASESENLGAAEKQIRAAFFAASAPPGDGDYVRLLYQRPTFQPDSALFSDLLQWTPGMNTSEEDRAATVEREAGAGKQAEAGVIDPAARRLIERARQSGWQRATVPAGPGGDAFDITFDGAGRYVCQRCIGLGLEERTVSDGVTEWKFYPEIGVGARREASRFHRAKFETLIPWSLPPAEDLARGADLKAMDAQTVAIVPRRPMVAAAATSRRLLPLKSQRQVRLVFASDGRLAARQIIDVATGKSVYRQEYNARGRVTTSEAGKPAQVVIDLKLLPADAPDLRLHDEKLVILPMPLRTPEMAATADLGRKSYADWPADDALKVIAANVAARNEEAAITIAWKFFHHGDRRIGFHVLIMAGGLDWERWGRARWGASDTEASELTNEQSNPALAAYLNWRQAEIRDAGQNRMVPRPQPVVSDCVFFRRLVELHEITETWKPDRAKEPGVAEFRRAVGFVRDCPDVRCAWEVFSLIADYPASGEDARAFAGVAQRFTEFPAFSYTACYEQARALLRAGDTAAAQRLFEKNYRAAIGRGMVPPIDGDFRRGMEVSAPVPKSDPDGSAPSAWTKLMRDACDCIGHRNGSRAALAVVWQCWHLGDAALSDELLARTFAGATSGERDMLRLGGVEFLSRTGRPDRSETMLSPLLAQKPWSQFSELWRLDEVLASRAKRPVRALAALEGALELEFAAIRDGSEVSAIRRDYGRLLSGYEFQAEAAAQLGQPPPDGLVDKVIRAADHWRSIDPDGAAPSRLAGETLRRLGKEDLAWDYFTVPLSAHPAEAKPWSDLARTLRAEGDADLADRAYAAACDANPSDAQAIWDRAEFLEESGQSVTAHALYLQIAEGNWDPQFESLQRSARGRAR